MSSKINQEEILKQTYLTTINSLESMKAIIEFEIKRNKERISEIEYKQNCKLYVKNNTKGPIFVGEYKIIDYVSKKDFMEKVPAQAAEKLYEKGDIEDVDRSYYLDNRTDRIQNKPTPIKSTRIGEQAVFMGTSVLENIAQEINIEGVKNIEDKYQKQDEYSKLASAISGEDVLGVENFYHIDKRFLEDKLKERKPPVGSTELKTDVKKTDVKKTDVKKTDVKKTDVKKTKKEAK